MIPRTKATPKIVEEKPVVEMEAVEVTDFDFHFIAGPPLMLTLFPGDALADNKDQPALWVTQESGIITTIYRDKLTHVEKRSRTLSRPKKDTAPILR